MRDRSGRPHWIVVDEAHHLLPARRVDPPTSRPRGWHGMGVVSVHPHPRLLEMRDRSGRPHWIVVDEAHPLLPARRVDPPTSLPREWHGMVFVTVHPDRLLPQVLPSIDWVVALGDGPDQTIAAFCKAIGRDAPPFSEPAKPLEKGEVLAWRVDSDEPPFRLRAEPPRSEHSRHSRKYAEGDLGPDHSFYFRGPKDALNLRAQNLIAFLQMAEGVDEATWRHHLQQGDYSTWFRDEIKDEDLADEAARIEKEQADAPVDQSRAAIREAIERRYTLPDTGPSGEQD
jgi:hypothetical protein